MKVKWDFVTNSSSTAYIITNKTNEEKHILDFALENMDLLENFLKQYDWHSTDPRYEAGPFLESAARNGIVFEPKETERCVFGDEDGTVIGAVYDYMLREGGSSESFIWHFDEYLR